MLTPAVLVTVLLMLLLMLMVAAVILYSLRFLIAATSIWFVRTWNAISTLNH